MTEQEKQQLVEAVITQLKQEGTDVSQATVVSGAGGVAYVLCYDSNNNIIRVTPNTFDGVSEITWEQSNHIDDYIEAGVYDIAGTRWHNDGLPITNVGENATIAARLVVTVTPEGATTYRHSVGQTLILSNAEGKETKVYTRNGNRTSTDGGVTYTVTWGEWANLQENVQVQVTGENGLDNLINNGIYSGVWVKNAAHVETFVMVVINNYAAAGQAGVPKSITQFKYSITVGGSMPIYETRVGTSENEWGGWKNINANEFEDIKSRALQANTFTVDSVYSDHVNLYMRNLDGDTRIQKIPAATERTAGVMTAEDKKEQVKKTPLVNGDIIVGKAREVYSRQGKTDTSTFLRRTTAGGTSISDGVAALKQIGGSIVKNIMPRLVSTNVNIKYNVEEIDGFFKISAKEEYIEDTTGSSYIGYKSLPFVKGHSYYVGTTCFRKSDGNQITLILGFNGINAIDRLVLPEIPANEWHYVSGIKVINGDNITGNVSIYPFGVTNNPMTAEPLLIRGGINIIDLTEMYGAGNEPTQEECDRMFGTMDALPQGLTTAQPTGLKSTGFNQWNPANVLLNKSIVENAIEDDVADRHIAVVECLLCKTGAGENNGYVIGYGEGDTWNEANIEVYLSPLNPLDYIGQDVDLYMHKLEKDATYGTYVPHIKGYLLVVTPTIDKLCAHLHWSGDRAKTDYEEYIESNVALPAIPQMSEWGLAGMGEDIADTIDLERMVYTKKVGCVDMGTLSWYIADSTRFTSVDLTNLTKKKGIVQIACDRYIALPTSAIKETLINAGLADIVFPVVYDNNVNVITSVEYATSKDFSAAVSGVKLYYELAEPMEYPIVIKSAPNYIGSDYGVEEFVGSNVPLAANILFYMRSLVSETRNFIDQLYTNTQKSDAKEVANYITNSIEDNKQLATEAPNLALRALFVAAGAEYNDTDQVIEKTITFPAHLDGSYETLAIPHMPKSYYLGGVGNITEQQMLNIYNVGCFTLETTSRQYTLQSANVTILPLRGAWSSTYIPISMERAFYGASSVKSIKFTTGSANTLILVNSLKGAFEGLRHLKYILQVLKISYSSDNTIFNNAFYNCLALEEIRISGLCQSVSFSYSSNISKGSILYAIENAAPKTDITITLHADAYARLAEDADIVAALEAQPLVTLVSA